MIKTPLKAIRAKCIECSCGSKNEVKVCPITECPLYSFRLGKNPNKKELTPEQRQILSERAKKNFHSIKHEGKNESEV